MSFSDDRKKIIALDEYCNVKELDLENKTINTIVSKESLIELDALRKKSGQQYVEHEKKKKKKKIHLTVLTCRRTGIMYFMTCSGMNCQEHNK